MNRRSFLAKTVTGLLALGGAAALIEAPAEAQTKGKGKGKGKKGHGKKHKPRNKKHKRHERFDLLLRFRSW